MFTHFVQSRRNLSHSRQAFWAFGFHEISQKKATLFKGHSLLLSWKDSNPRKRNQNPMCYHYTTGQFLIATAKVLPPRKNPTFFQKIISKPKNTCYSDVLSARFCALNGYHQKQSASLLLYGR